MIETFVLLEQRRKTVIRSGIQDGLTWIIHNVNKKNQKHFDICMEKFDD